jgi:hypothetical protein
MNEVCGGSCVNLKDNSTPKQIAKQYYDAGTYGMLCGMKSLISPSEDDNEIYVSGDDNLTILNELLVLCKSNWRFEGSPLKITDVKKTTSLTTETAIQKKKEASLILQGLINNAKGLTAGIKKEKWQSSLDELNNTADDTLCSQENLDKVKEQKTAAENDLKSYGYALNDTEKSECQKLIDMLEQFPTYCKT